MPEPAHDTTRNPFALQVDLRDAMGAGGVLLTLGAAATWSWSAAAGVLGLGFVAAALRLSSGRR